jgi:hypothetical protein
VKDVASGGITAQVAARKIRNAARVDAEDAARSSASEELPDYHAPQTAAQSR